MNEKYITQELYPNFVLRGSLFFSGISLVFAIYLIISSNGNYFDFTLTPFTTFLFIIIGFGFFICIYAFAGKLNQIERLILFLGIIPLFILSLALFSAIAKLHHAIKNWLNKK